MWERGGVVVRREILNDGTCWFELPVIVVVDEPDLLATFIAPGAPYAFPPGPGRLPSEHPWYGRTHWQGHGVLTLQRPQAMDAVWVFWEGDQRELSGWYVNFQEPFRRSPFGYETQDLELDIWIPREGSWQWKDDELLELRIEQGRYAPEQVAATRAEGARVAAELDAGRRWWDESWADWEPDPSWVAPAFPDGYRTLQP